MKIILHFFLITVCFVFPSKIGLALDAGDVQTQGGLVPGSRIIRVTSLADSGKGSLRQAIECGPCLIVFDVAGAIELKSDLDITRGPMTIAGETAPAPGIVLHNGTLQIHSSNIVISNIAIYPGSSEDPKIAENRDGISIYGSPSKHNKIQNVILRNVSVGWGIDENIGLQGLTDGVRIERSLIAEALRKGGHPKGVHSMNLLMGGTVGRAIILGSVFAAAEQRSPRLTTGNRVTFMNNLIVGTGAAASHLDTSQDISGPGAIDMIGNYYIASPHAYCKRKAIEIDEKFLSAIPPTTVFLQDNLVNNDAKAGCLVLPSDDLPGLAKAPQTHISGWTQIAAINVQQEILPFAGSHAKSRNPIDARIIRQISEGSLTIPDSEADIGGFPPITATSRPAAIPRSLTKIETEADLNEINTWLCGEYKNTSGLTSCP